MILSGAVLLCGARGEQTNSAPPTRVTASYRTVTPSITLRHISPIAYFRGILGMTPSQREKALAGKTSEERQAILEKVREYESMSREVREERLRQTELHWRLISLMRLKPAERDRNLREISPLYQPMVLEQLRQWDELPDSTRKALLDNEKFIRTYVEWQVRSPVDQEETVKKLSPQRRAYFANELKRWQALPEDQRTELCAQFQRFFVMTGEEQTNSIRTLSEPERRQISKELQAFKELPSAQRQRCINSFDKFATMAPTERAQFLQNAAKWEAMTAHERELWSTMVAELPLTPPVPPGMPPMPPAPWQTSPPSPGETGR
ncbi:MAG TPA: DUF3106 domain-containing protein [Verrucomicrobiae bacterium]|nr:DUF3106 domain-containing protein [Verrucomicrobiae bacterium]